MTALALRPLSSRPSLRARAVSPVSFAAALGDHQAEWLAARIRHMPLFEVPWDGDARFIPVRTTKALKDASDVFGNQMWDRLDWFLDGQEACYLTSGPVKAVITLRTDPIYGWTVREIVGAGNRALPLAAENQIADAFAAAGFRRRHRSVLM